MSSLIVDNFDIRELSDEALMSKLAEYGFSAGPIVDSTRSVYQRKLYKLVSGDENMVSNDFEEEPEILEDEQTPSPPKYSLSSSRGQNLAYSPLVSPDRFNFDDLRRRPLPRAQSDFESSATVSSPYANIQQASRQQFKTVPATVQKKFPLKTILIIACIVLGFLFFVYQNMESSPANPVPKT